MYDADAPYDDPHGATCLVPCSATRMILCTNTTNHTPAVADPGRAMANILHTLETCNVFLVVQTLGVHGCAYPRAADLLHSGSAVGSRAASAAEASLIGIFSDYSL